MPAILSSRQRIALRLAWRFMAPYRWRMLGALVALLFTAAITLSLGQGIRLLVDQGFLTASPELLNRYILLFFVLVLGLAVGTFVRFYLVSWIGERFVADIRKRVFDHLIELHPGFYETNRSSEIQSRLTADTTLLQTVIGSSLSMALRNALMLVGGVLLMFVTNAKLTSIVVLALPLVIAPILLFGRRVRSLSRKARTGWPTSAATSVKPSVRSRPCRPTTTRRRIASASPAPSNAPSTPRASASPSAPG